MISINLLLDCREQKCICQPGYGGAQCQDFNPCWAEPCRHGATCSKSSSKDDSSEFVCICPPGYRGDPYSRINFIHFILFFFYEIRTRLWRSYWLLRSGSLPKWRTLLQSRWKLSLPMSSWIPWYFFLSYKNCKTEIYYYSLKLPISGVDCEQDIDECISSPCRDGSSCLNQPGSYICICPRGLTGKFQFANFPFFIHTVMIFIFQTGKNCQDEIDDCDLSPCQNRAVCENLQGPGNYTCHCRPGFKGRECQINIGKSIIRFIHCEFQQ